MQGASLLALCAPAAAQQGNGADLTTPTVFLAGLALGALLVCLWAGAAVHAARQRQRAQAAGPGVLTWETDRDGRFMRWPQPPPAALADPQATLLSAFDAGEQQDRWRTTLEAGSAFGPLTVLARDDGSRWTLSGRPLSGLLGRPTGFAGVAMPETQHVASPAAWRALIDGAASGLALAERGPHGWWLLHANEAALAALGPPAKDGSAHTLGADWQNCLERRPGADPTPQGWCVAMVPGAAPALAVLSRSQDEAEGGEGDAAAFSYTISHDLRAPLRVVDGFTRIIKEDYGPGLDRVANDHLDRVLSAVARMNQMIDAMLMLARLSSQPLQRQPVDLSQLAGYVVDELRQAAPQRHALIEIEPGMGVTGDPTLLRRVLENLLGNAWKYTAKRPEARIVFARETVEARPCFVVRDNGAGFNMRSVDRLFGLFQRLHSASDFPGTGVGLASVRRIVRRHGGEIWADAEPDRGAAFYFTLSS